MMMVRFYVVLIFISAINSSANYSTNITKSHLPLQAPAILPPSPPPFSSISLQQWRRVDYYVVAFQWPKTVVRLYHGPNANTPLVRFTLHGTWASNSLGYSIPPPCRGPSFDIRILMPLIGDLNRFWPSFLGSYQTFWQHEWDQHGICSNLPLYDYFLNSIWLAYEGQDIIENALRQQGILAGDYYTISEYIDAIEMTGFIPHVQCVKLNNVLYLKEIRLCCDTNFVIQSCTRQRSQITDCGDYSQISVTLAYLPY